MHRYLLGVSLAMTACGECELADDLREYAGSGAADCGRVAIGADATPVHDCVVAAFSSSKPFYAQYDRQGIDSKVVFGVAGDRSGKVTYLLWDSDPSGGSQTGAVITAERCEGPTPQSASMADMTTLDPFECASMTQLGRTCE